MSLNYDEITKKVLDSDPQVRFAGVANSKGEMIVGVQKDNVEKMLDENETKMSIHYALQKRDFYTNLAYKIGNERSSITEYEKVTLISIPINSQELFLTSTEPRADYLKVIDYIHSLIDSPESS